MYIYTHIYTTGTRGEDGGAGAYFDDFSEGKYVDREREREGDDGAREACQSASPGDEGRVVASSSGSSTNTMESERDSVLGLVASDIKTEVGTLSNTCHKGQSKSTGGKASKDTAAGTCVSLCVSVCLYMCLCMCL